MNGLIIATMILGFITFFLWTILRIRRDRVD